MTAENLYLLIDSAGTPLARGKLENQEGDQLFQLRVLDEKEDEVACHEIIQLIGMGSRKLAVRCQLLRQRGDRVVLRKITALDPKFQRDLRVTVSFRSFLYPVSGSWKGRREIQSLNLSCGGIAFYGTEPLEIGEVVEVVIPVTTQPLILRCQILRLQEAWADRALYAGKFVDVCHDEETMLQEAVFRVQLQSQPHRSADGDNKQGVKP